MDSLQKATQQTQDALHQCFAQIRFARAAELARSRRYLEAEGLLAPNGRESSDPKELDLLARISAQQRRYGSARRLWECALKHSPGNADYERAIERTREAERSQMIFRKGAIIALLALAVAALVAAVWIFLPRRSSQATPQGSLQPAPAIPPPAPMTQLPVTSIPPPAPATPQPAPATPQPAPAGPQPVSPPTEPQPAQPPVSPPAAPESQ